MRMIAAALLGAIFLFPCLPADVGADEKPVQLALFDPAQVFPNDTSVRGVRLNLLYGYNQDMVGLDLGLVNRTAGVTKGLQHGGVGLVESDFVGWQDNFVNVTKGSFQGLQSGAFNSVGSGEGVQFGVLNVADHVHGLQLGLLNVTNTLEGLQIGLLNVASGKESLPVLPIVNWSF